MHRDWYRTAKTEEERRDRAAVIAAGARAIEVLRVEMARRESQAYSKMIAQSRLDHPNWALEQAALSAELAVYAGIIKMLTLTEENTECPNCTARVALQTPRRSSISRQLLKSLQKLQTWWDRVRSTPLSPRR